MGGKNNSKTGKPAIPVQTLVPGRAVIEAQETSIEGRKLNEITELIWLPKGLSEEEKHARILRALDLYESLEPGDGAEGMLAAQMVGTHLAALDCLRLAALPNQTFAGRDLSLKHAQKLMALYTQQLAALNKHRGKGQQTVTVEHVNVQPGGQAIVGTVTADRRGKRRGADPAIEHKPAVPIQEAEPKAKALRRKGAD